MTEPTIIYDDISPILNNLTDEQKKTILKKWAEAKKALDAISEPLPERND